MSNKNNVQTVWALLTWLIIATLLLSGCGLAGTSKMYRVGIFGFVAFGQIAEGLKAGMTELGYIEGENITYDVQFFDVALDTPEAGNAILQKFISDDVDLVFSFPTEQTVMANAATKGTDIPLVFDFAGLEGNDLVENVREPGGNITGVRYPGPGNHRQASRTFDPAGAGCQADRTILSSGLSHDCAFPGGITTTGRETGHHPRGNSR